MKPRLPRLGLPFLISPFLAIYLSACEPHRLPATPLAAPTPSASATRSAVSVSVLDSAAASPAQIQTNALTVGEALWGAGYRLYLADEVSPSADALVTDSLTVTINRARPVALLADGQTLLTRTRRALVGKVLDDAGLALVGEDYTVPALDQPVPPDGVIRVVRVREEILTEQQVIPFETVYQARADWEIDTVQQLQPGVNGITQRRVRVRYEDGVEVGRVDEGQVMAQAPAARVVGYGTNIVLRTLDTPDGPVEYWRSYTMYATAYAAKFLGRPPGSPSYGRTASGKILTKGLVAIDRRYIPFGTRMYVPGYGFAEAADTGGGVKGRWIDLGYDDWNYQSWHQVVTVYFLTPIPPPDQIAWIIPSTVP
ncbi:MAG: G5 domain-containing protein [Anaerolineales bacterium]